MTTNNRFSSVSKIVSGVLNEAPDLTFSSTRRQFTMPQVYGKPATESSLDVAAGKRMAAAYGGGSVPSGYSEAERQAAIRKAREQPDRTTIGGREGTKQPKETEEEGENWIDKAQRVADYATLAGSFVPGLNVASAATQAISAGIDVAQGQYGQAGLRGAGAGIGLIPGGRLLTTAGAKGAAAVHAGMPGAAAVTGLKRFLPAMTPASWKPAIQAVGKKSISSETAKLVGGVLARTPAAMMAGGPSMSPTKDEGDQETQTQAAPIAPPKPKQKQVEFEGQMWDENLVKQIQQHRMRQPAQTQKVQQKGKLTPPRKPSGEVDMEAWHLMTGMKIPKSYDETKRAIEVTKPYNYDPLVDPALKSRYEKVRQQIAQNM